MKKISIVGGGLAGCEAAWQAANRGVKVTLYEMRDGKIKTFAHQTDNLCELVCSNSFRSDDPVTAIGLLHAEMRKCNSLIMKCADDNRIPAGSALALDRELFSKQIESSLAGHPNIEIKREVINTLPIDSDEQIIFATGPLTSTELAEDIKKQTGEEHLAFFDAIAPTILKDSIDFSKVWFQSRYDKGDGKDYLNCPLTKEQYYKFIDALIEGDKTEFKDWEKDTPYFEGCLPIEVMAERGIETLRFGPMKPVGLTNPHSSDKQYAVVQLRQDNKLGSIYNIVGFQTKLKYGAQKGIFRMIPGLENAEFARLGGIHRNTFINSPKLLDKNLRLKISPNIRFAGQVTGVEGYVESAACGMLAGIFAAKDINKQEIINPPAETALGALLNHITVGADSETFQPMNINYGLFPPLEGKVHKKERKSLLSKRSLSAHEKWLA